MSRDFPARGSVLSRRRSPRRIRRGRTYREHSTSSSRFPGLRRPTPPLPLSFPPPANSSPRRWDLAHFRPFPPPPVGPADFHNLEINYTSTVPPKVLRAEGDTDLEYYPVAAAVGQSLPSAICAAKSHNPASLSRLPPPVTLTSVPPPAQCLLRLRLRPRGRSSLVPVSAQPRPPSPQGQDPFPSVPSPRRLCWARTRDVRPCWSGIRLRRAREACGLRCRVIRRGFRGGGLCPGRLGEMRKG
jgi:hypothetical protein